MLSLQLVVLLVIVAQTVYSSLGKPMTEVQNAVFFQTWHKGDDCSSSPLGFTLPAYRLGSCTPSSSAAGHPSRLSCWTGVATYSVLQDTYSSSTCEPSTKDLKGVTNRGLVSHGKFCTKNAISAAPGVGAKTRCAGGGMEKAVYKREMVLVSSYTNAQCVAESSTATSSTPVFGTFLGVCQPMDTSGGKLWYHRKLTWVSGDGVTTPLRLLESKYAVGDKTCQAAVTTSTTVVFPATSTSSCSADPLFPGRFYSHVAYTNDLSVGTPAWVGLSPSSFSSSSA